ncbi:hypothetical protein [Halorhabdus amylolytica]|uniref:hypothetical protein n=1 Tax=Halorhabdus amylolytica TaxID=2559573 RepID=UPI0010AB486A|nr:hypothetical protein [Halorhabdus amylolytica]
MRRSFVVLAAAVVVLSSMAGAATAVFAADSGAANPTINEGSYTIQKYNLSWDDPLTYEGNQGDLLAPNADVNESVDNPYGVTATDLAVDDFNKFPRKSDETENSASALDGSEWTVSQQPSGVTASISDSSTASNVDAVEVSATGMTSGDTAIFRYSNVSITSDAEKRYLSIASDVTTAASGASAEIRVEDADGDYVAVDLLDTSKQETDDGVLANATGEGNVLQVQLGQRTVEGSGDGTLSEIQALEVRISDGDVVTQMPLINAEAMSPYTFGEKRVDSDDDDELETEVIEEPTGPYDVHSLSTFGDAFSSAIVHGLSIPVQHEAADLPAEDIEINATETDKYPGYDVSVDYWYRLEVPTAYDLSHADLELTQTQQHPSDRYVAVEYIEGAGDTEFDNLGSMVGRTAQFDSEGQRVVLDDTIQPGQTIVVHEEHRYTQDKWDEIKTNMQEAGGGGAVMPQQDGGISATFGAIIGGIVGAIGIVVTRLRNLVG